MVVIYSYDMNVLRALPKKGHAKCLPFGKGGRKLKPSELLKVAKNNWGERSVTEFHYLGKGEGYAL